MNEKKKDENKTFILHVWTKWDKATSIMSAKSNSAHSQILPGVAHIQCLIEMGI